VLTPWFRIGDHAIAFTEPRLLMLAWAAPAFLLLALVATLLRRGKRPADAPRGVAPGIPLWIASALRTVAFLAAVGAASGATVVETEREDRMAVVAVADESASISDDESRWMQDWLARMVGAMRRDDDLSVLTFGRDARLVSGPAPPAMPPRAPSGVDRSATNLMAAIDSGASLVSAPGSAIVVLSDGNQTVGDATAAAESARRRGFKLFPVVPPRAQAPLTIEHVAAPDLVREGRDLRLAVAIANRGHEDLEATLVARQGDRELGRVPLRVAPGRSVVDAEVRAGTPGHYAISVALEAAPNVASARAHRTAALTVLARPRLLLLSHDAALEPLLREAGFDVVRVTRLGVGAEELARYHAVVLGDVDRRDLPPEAQRALDDYVRDYGGGLLLAAGRGLLSDPQVRGTTLERLLPVRIKEQVPPKKERDTIALFLVIDRSSSMSYGVDSNQPQPTRIDYARRAALALIAQLGDGDQVGAIAFDTQTSLLAPLQPLATNRALLNDTISRLQPSGGTDFKEALEIAARQLIASNKRTKHVILLSDGASIRPSGEHEPLIAALARSGVTVTSIRIGNDKDSYALVKTIAEQTGGTFYLVTDAVSLPNLMIQDTRQRAGREEERPPDERESGATFRPHVRHSSEALGGLRDEDLPALQGYAVVPLKAGAEEWLVTEHRGDRVPILAGWQNGLGRVAVFTADPSHDWQGWGQVRRFWSQLVRWVARPESSDELRLAVRREADRSLLAIDTYDTGAGGEVRVRLTGRDGRVRDLTPAAIGPRHYELALPPLDTIEPRVVVSLARNGQNVFTRDEWLPSAGQPQEASTEDPEAEPNWSLLAQLAEITGGEVNAPLATVLSRAPADRQIALPLAPTLAAAALVFALTDVALRLLLARAS